MSLQKKLAAFGAAASLGLGTLGIGVGIGATPARAAGNSADPFCGIGLTVCNPPLVLHKAPTPQRTYVCLEPSGNGHSTVVIGATAGQCAIWAQEAESLDATSPGQLEDWASLACFLANFVGVSCYPDA